jgi:hypothetical protein
MALFLKAEEMATRSYSESQIIREVQDLQQERPQNIQNRGIQLFLEKVPINVRCRC